MTSQDAIAAALLNVQKQVDSKKTHIVRSTEISRPDRELLLATGWLQEIMRGWYILVRPDVATGDTAAWYANYWDFLRLYLQDRFGDNYCLSAESSLEIHVQSTIIPRQVIVIVKDGAGLRQLKHETSILMYADSANFPEEIVKAQGLNVMDLAFALCKVAPSYFHRNPAEAELALRLVQSPADISRQLIRYNFKIAAARLIGAYQFLQDNSTADAIKNDLIRLGMIVTPINPFDEPKPLLAPLRLKSPCAGRIQAMWQQARSSVIEYFPKPPGLPLDADAYLHHIDDIYQLDAYNSLSIEGYQVTPELINKVKNNQWSPETSLHDLNFKNALAAKGYYDAFQAVKLTIAEIIHGGNAAILVKQNLQIWYQKLFAPSAQAGIIPPESLFGYRNDRVYIRNSRHSPPPKEAVLDAMEAFFNCIENEPSPAVNAILGHYFFVFIHPYMDGNGRLGRFLMNALLASGGYPWTIVRVENRARYISTLEDTHNHFDMAAFTQFIYSEMQVSLG